MSDEEKVVSLPVKARKVSKAPLTVTHVFTGCQHPRVEVCERLAEVTCRDCREKLNPIWVLINIARDDRLLVDRWASMKADIQLMGKRTRVKCRHCDKFTPVHSGAGSYQLSDVAAKIRRDVE